DGDLAVAGGVVERDADGRPTGVLREESAWEFRRRFVFTQIDQDERLAAMRAGIRLAVSRGVTSVHDKDGWLGNLPLFPTPEQDGVLNLRVWQSLPHEQLDALEALDVRSGLGNRWLRAGYLKAFMDGTLGSQTARMLDGSGVEITSREELEEIVRRGARIGWP